MPAPVFVAEYGGSRVYKVGRAGYDSGQQDAGGAYTGNLRTGKISPAGEDGLCLFRRVVLRTWRTGAYAVTFTIYVDGKQTQIYDSNGNKINQSVKITKTAPTLSPDESIVEVSVLAQGTYMEVEIDILSTDVTGTCLPEEVECHYLPIRPTKSRTDAKSTT